MIRKGEAAPASNSGRIGHDADMRVFNSNTLIEFGKSHADADQGIRELNKVLRAVRWSKMQDVMDNYPSATVLNAERVVFKMQGNAFRVIVAFNFRKQGAFIKFVGTHAHYDSIDALTVDAHSAG